MSHIRITSSGARSSVARRSSGANNSRARSRARSNLARRSSGANNSRAGSNLLLITNNYDLY